MTPKSSTVSIFKEKEEKKVGNLGPKLQVVGTKTFSDDVNPDSRHIRKTIRAKETTNPKAEPKPILHLRILTLKMHRILQNEKPMTSRL